jgi:hypothetical protein
MTVLEMSAILAIAPFLGIVIGFILRQWLSDEMLDQLDRESDDDGA